MRKLCPTCGGKGSIPDPKCVGIPMLYVGPNGEGSPYVPCQSCGMQGWVNDDHQCTCRCTCKGSSQILTPPLPFIHETGGLPQNPGSISIYYPSVTTSVLAG